MNDPLLNKRALVDTDSIVYSSCAVGKDDEGNEVERFALANAKTMVKRILKRFQTDCDYRLFLGGKDNFRRDIASIQVYKGKRPPKPTHYDAVREYLCNIWQAELVDGMEAEDKLAIVYNESPDDLIMVHIDKDINQVPGLHWNYQKDEYYVVTEEQGNRSFWVQVLMGDNIDAILGIPSLGMKKACALTENVRSFEEGWIVAKNAYYEAFGKQRCYKKAINGTNKDGSPKMRYCYGPGSGLERHDGTYIDWREALLENCRLIYLLRNENEHFKEPE